MNTNIILENISENIIVIDEEFRILYFNNKAKKIFPEIQKNFLLPPILLKELEETLFNYTDKKTNSYILNLNNSFYNVDIKKFLNDNKYSFLIEINKKQINQKKQTKYYKTILNSSESIILVTNGQKIKNINKRFFDIFDYKNIEEFKQKHSCISELFQLKEDYYLMPYKNGLNWLEQIEKNKNNLSNSKNKVCLKDKFDNERIFQVESSGKIFYDENEEVITFTEITSILESRKIIEEQSKHAVMGEMIAMIAHQWRQPLTTLTTIYAKINTLKELDMLTDNEFNKAYNKSNKIIEHLSNTINDFRNFFNKDSREEFISIYKLINKSYEIFEVDLKQKEIKFYTKYHGNVENTIIQINPSKITQILLNLIKNAFDVLIEIKDDYKFILINVEIKKDLLSISVEDNGGGIKQNIIKDIFNPYFSTKSKNGTGLGLYMCRLIAFEHLKGQLEVKNTQKGAMFILNIPVKIKKDENETNTIK